MQFKLLDDAERMAIWFPYDFFVLSGQSEGGRREDVDRDLFFLQRYQTIVLQCGTSDDLGQTTYADEASLKRRAVLILPDGRKVAPIGRLPPKVDAMMGTIKAMANAEPGDDYCILVLVFPTSAATGNAVVRTDRQDKLTLVLQPEGDSPESRFSWRTPFDATTSRPPCTSCKEPVSAKWSFCDSCGPRLVPEIP